MKKVFLKVAFGVILFIGVDGIWAQQQDQNQVSPNSVPRREITMPMRMSGRGPNRQIDPNEMARREQRRQQMREQIEERTRQRRLRADQNELTDINAPHARVRPERGSKDAEQQHKQHLMAIEQQLSQELVKHRERVAKLTRIRELAQQQGNTEVIDKADKLLEQERQHHQAKVQRMERRKNAIIQFAEKADANKP